jgi:hypothetical protein
MPTSTTDPRKGIPRGAVRIVGFDPADKQWFPVDETRVYHDAYRLADAVNKGRKEPTQIAYYVYDTDTQLRSPRSLAYEARHCVGVARM